MVRANLVAETDSGSVADSMGGIFEGIISLDLHHDVNSDVPGSISMRFVMLRKSGRWCPSLPTGHPKTRRSPSTGLGSCPVTCTTRSPSLH